MKNYGLEEYWATIEEFYEHGGGDCEDFAIAKYTRLLEISYPSKDMALMIGTKIINGKKENHTALRINYMGVPLENPLEKVL